ncbi:hypothetical protein AQPE_4310 [Aquipluma nitroreducens]|uniref:Outer membrane protein beta-barrel domain-containing protein n=1 Tax=Aquipluma nitroreducens TaxID=2010828 RepID=A0A5K7SF80_9BACT|nr:hypothetical protein [Aquipluma nitroreducens]BBE20119.1 hypothetical protein AQPE_4310 [Aquipluma nitroreducens]
MKAISIRLFLLLVFAFVSGNIFGSGNKDSKLTKKIFAPDYLNFQYAGNLGLGSVGIGYISVNNKSTLGFSYGYLPESINKVEVHTLSLKRVFHISKHRFSKNLLGTSYMGTNIILSKTKNTYIKFPNHFPSKYYFTNAVHFAPFIGAKFDNILTNKKKLFRYPYIEIGTIDYYLFNLIKYKQLDFVDCLNVSMGVSFCLNKK